MDGTLFPFAVPEASDLPPMIIDSFAGGGGASTGIEMALGRSPDVAINHDPVALAMHEANHPNTRHMASNIWQIDPADVAKGRRVALLWTSPDCTQHSKAKGGKPVIRGRRDLAHVVILWAQRARPEVILLENVEEFQDWGPLTADDRPDPERRGETFKAWVKELRSLGYKVEWRELRACDYGAPTIRKRLFLCARRDGRPIVWPKPSHGDPKSTEVRRGKLKPWRTAAEILDWSLPCPSIFDTSAEIMAKHGLRAVRPLQDATLRRIAAGVQRYIIDAAQPYFVTYGQHGGASRSAADPLHTITASRKDQNAVIVPTLVQTGYGEREGQAPRALDLHKPLGTVVAGGGKHALIAAFLAQHNTGAIARRADAPMATVTTSGAQVQLVQAQIGHDIDRGRMVAAFLQKYYGKGVGQELDGPLHTVSTRDTFGLVTVEIDGQSYAITDIGMRMLTPREQFRAQGFPDSYEIERGADGHEMTKAEQTRMCGNSVSPVMARALVRANCPHLMARQAAA